MEGGRNSNQLIFPPLLLLLIDTSTNKYNATYIAFVNGFRPLGRERGGREGCLVNERMKRR